MVRTSKPVSTDKNFFFFVPSAVAPSIMQRATYRANRALLMRSRNLLAS